MPHDMLVPVATAWRVFGLWIVEQPPVWRVAANISREALRAANKGSAAWGLGEVLTNVTVKSSLLTKRLQLSQTYTDPFVRSNQWKKESVVWYAERMSLEMSGSITAVSRELARYKLDLVRVDVVRWNDRATVRAGGYFLLKRKRKSSAGKRIVLYTTV